MRRIAAGALLASLLFSVCAVTATPAAAWEYRQTSGNHYSRHDGYRSSCCYRRVVKRIVTYQRVPPSGYLQRPSYRSSYRSAGYDGGYTASRYRHGSYERSYRPRYNEYSGTSYRRPYRSYRSRYDYYGDSYRPRYRSYESPRYGSSRYSDDGGYERQPYRSYSATRYNDDGGYDRRPYSGYRTRSDW